MSSADALFKMSFVLKGNIVNTFEDTKILLAVIYDFSKFGLYISIIFIFIILKNIIKYSF